MALAITSVLTALLYRFGHLAVGVALLAEHGGKVFHHETIGAQCQSTLGCSHSRSSVPVQFLVDPWSCIAKHVACGSELIFGRK